jgi:hypothetical protein
MKSNVEFYYDPESDSLEIFIKGFMSVNSPPLYEEIAPDIFEGKDEETGVLRGYKIFNLTKQNNLKNVKVSLPIDISALKS